MWHGHLGAGLLDQAWGAAHSTYKPLVCSDRSAAETKQAEPKAAAAKPKVAAAAKTKATPKPKPTAAAAAGKAGVAEEGGEAAPKVKRPLNAYMQYVNANRGQVKGEAGLAACCASGSSRGAALLDAAVVIALCLTRRHCRPAGLPAPCS